MLNEEIKKKKKTVEPSYFPTIITCTVPTKRRRREDSNSTIEINFWSSRDATHAAKRPWVPPTP